jgi:hypothetical protein
MIAVYYSPESMTYEQYQAVGGRLEGSGAKVEGRKHHSCFGEDGHLMVYEVWDSTEDLEAYEAHLNPILNDVGIKLSRAPDKLPVVNMEE